MDNKKSKPLGGGVYQLNNRCNYLPFDLQLFALEYNKVNNPYEFYLNKHTWTKGNIKKVYNLKYYYGNIPNYDTITTLPEENANYIKEALPNVTDCINMLCNCSALTSVDTNGWDTSNITDMFGMFWYCESLTTLDVSNWDTSKVTDMYRMFSDCNSLTALDISKWDTSKATGMDYMFNNCSTLETLNVSKWDTSNVTDMYRMFADCNSLTALDISKWDTSNVTDMLGMFDNCNALTAIKGVIDMNSCTSYNKMFAGCYNLTGVKIKNPPYGITATSGIGGLAAGKYEIVS